MTQDCIFCKIISGKIPVKPVYENKEFICIQDLHPQAKTHLLVIPKVHVPALVSSTSESGSDSDQLTQARVISQILEVGVKVAREQGLISSGFRTVINNGADAGQTVFHLHMHILGGEPLRERFGAHG